MKVNDMVRIEWAGTEYTVRITKIAGSMVSVVCHGRRIRFTKAQIQEWNA